MKKIAIIENAIGLNNEKGYSRFRFLPKFLAENYGYDVELITSTFQHWEKKQRDIAQTMKNQSCEEYKTTLIPEPGYKKNIDLQRIKSHAIFAKNVIRHLEEVNDYDLIYCTIPDNNLTAKVSAFAKSHGAKMIVDIEDLWPEAMQMVIPLGKVLDKAVYERFRRDARTAYENADAFIGTSDEYRDVPEKIYGITGKPAKTVYVGCDLSEFDAGAKEYASQIEKDPDDFWITYAGTLGASYDLSTFIKALALIKEDCPKVKGVILGGGPDEEKLKDLAAERSAPVIFAGYQPYPKMAAYLTRSDITINSFVKSAPQSIVNKIADYLAAGKPMINTLSSPEFRAKVKADRFGANVAAEDPKKLAALIRKMTAHKEVLEIMGRNARKTAETQFDRRESYKVIVRLIEELLEEE